MGEPVLTASGLVKRFGRLTALEDVGFSLLPGEALGVIGPNGSGKTTLVNLLTGFVRPSGGKVVFAGRDLTGMAPHRIASLGLARTFQTARPFFRLSAWQNLVIPQFSRRMAHLAGGRWGGREETALDLLEEVGFERDALTPHKLAGSLPHGLLKRLELARCLALRPRVMVLDEIFSGLSPAEVAGLLPVIERIRDKGCAVIMVEHRLRELFRVVGRVMVLQYGRMIAEGRPAAVLDNPTVRSAYLGAE